MRAGRFCSAAASLLESRDSTSTGMEKVLDKLYAVIEDEWKKMDPAKLWVISDVMRPSRNG